MQHWFQFVDMDEALWIVIEMKLESENAVTGECTYLHLKASTLSAFHIAAVFIRTDPDIRLQCRIVGSS